MDKINEKILEVYEKTVLNKGLINEDTWDEVSEGSADKEAATELVMYVDNDSQLYRQMVTPWRKNLIAKIARGIFDYNKAVMGLAKNLFTEGAKRYAKDFSTGGDWADIFSVPTRKMAAEEWLDSYLGEAEVGEYDELLPKKYQKDGTRNIDYSKLRK